jgi:hypothetical protein
MTTIVKQKIPTTYKASFMLPSPEADMRMRLLLRSGYFLISPSAPSASIAASYKTIL